MPTKKQYRKGHNPNSRRNLSQPKPNAKDHMIHVYDSTWEWLQQEAKDQGMGRSGVSGLLDAIASGKFHLVKSELEPTQQQDSVNAFDKTD